MGADPAEVAVEVDLAEVVVGEDLAAAAAAVGDPAVEAAGGPIAVPRAAGTSGVRLLSCRNLLPVPQALRLFPRPLLLLLRSVIFRPYIC